MSAMGQTEPSWHREATAGYLPEADEEIFDDLVTMQTRVHIQESVANAESPISAIKKFVCKYLC